MKKNYLFGSIILFFVVITTNLYGQIPLDTPRYQTLKFLVSPKSKESPIDKKGGTSANLQNNTTVASLVPPTPEASALGTYATNPVSLSSGVVSIPISLYQIKQKDLSLDVSASYHAGGIRVEEVAPWTGLGVSLVGLGTITRTIRGNKADEAANGYMNISYNLDNISDWYQDESHPTEVNQFKNDYTAIDPIDTEADLFSFNFGKYAGKFVYNRTDGVFYTVPRQNLKLEYANDFSSWTITTEEGIKYVFGTSEVTTFIVSNCSSSIIGAGTMPNAPTAWHLTKIISPTDPTNFITINYLPENISMTTNGSSKRYLFLADCFVENTFNNNCQTTITTISSKVSEIVFRNGKISFVRSANNRCDLVGAKSLQKIILYDANNQRIKATRFYYSYFGNAQANSPNCGTTAFTGRLRLDSLKALGVTDSDSLPPHIFEYEPSTGLEPSTRSYAQDHWGFYNGEDTNDNLIPQYNYIDPNAGFKPKALGFNVRETSPVYALRNQIKRVIYPTGGYTDFQFEVNRWFQATCNQINCLKEEGISKQRFCIYDAATNSFPTVTFTINQGANCRNLCQGGVTAEIGVIGNLVGTGFDNIQFRISSTNPAFPTADFSSQTFATLALPNGTYTLRAFYVGAYDPDLPNNYIRVVWQEAISSDIPVGGLRVKKITDYDENANVVSLKNYRYTQEGSINSSASMGTIPFYGQFVYLQGNGCNGSGIMLSGESTYPLINTQGASVGYTRVEVSYGVNGINGKSVHTFTPVASYLPNYAFPTIATYQLDWKEGLSLTNQSLSATDVLLKADSSHHVLEVSPAQSLFKTTTGLRLAVAPVNRLYDVYFINGYRTPTDWYFTDFRQESVYHTNGTDVVKIPQWMQYNNQNLMPSVTKTLNSLGDTLKTDLKYPHDFSTNIIYAGMLNTHQNGMVIEQSESIRKVGNTTFDFLMKKRTNFNKFNNAFYAPSTLETQYAGGTLSQEVSFQYGDDALVSSITERNGIISAFSWYGTVDIGKQDLLKTLVKGSGQSIAQTSTFDYKPLVGLSSQIAPTNYTTSYLYDSQSRLQSIKDDQNYEMKRLFYHYQGQSKPAGFTLALPKTSNYVATYMARNALSSLDSVTNNTQTTISFVDGVGRAKQQVLFKGSPDKTKDILLGTALYDVQSRPTISYLPTPSNTNTGESNMGVQALAKAFYDNDNNPYNETIYEESPLNRPLQSFGAGQAWRTANKSVKYDYLTAGGGFIAFKITSTGVDASTQFAGNTLVNTSVESERGVKTFELKDRLGRVVYKLQQLDIGTFNYAITAYVYEDVNNRLRYVIPPEIYKKLGTGAGQVSSFSETDALFLEGVYAYHYEPNRGRLIEKHLPGAGWTYFCYDKNDRIVYEHDSKDAADNIWKITKYDALNRPIMTGIKSGIGSTSRQTIQMAFDSFTGQTYETRTTTLTSGLGAFYTNTSFPSGYGIAEADLKTIMYYDDYANWQTATAYNFQGANAFHAQGNTKGMMTGTFKRNLVTGTWQRMTMYYDYLGRNIQDFHLSNKGNIIRKDYQYRFNGELLKVRMEKKNSSNIVISTKIITLGYDHLGRKVSYIYNGKPIVKYSYDNIGRLTIKKFSPVGVTQGSKQTGNWTDVSSWLSGTLPTLADNVIINTGQTLTIPSGQSAYAGVLNDKGILKNFGTLNMGKANLADLYVENFKYHIRGFLKSINTDANNNLTNTLFSYRLDYESGVSGLFDGNISKQSWKSSIDSKARSFEFSYDGASRLKSGAYASIPAGENYGLNNVNYDANGNITALSRSGATNANFTTFGNVDNLTYTYPSNSNKLSKIQDATTTNTDLGDFRDGTNTDDDYEYWLDGSLKKDKNKKIALITYNYLKLPEVITFDDNKTITTEYDAEGTKLKKIVSGGETTDYEEDDIYVNGKLYQTSHDEGRIVDGIYEYNITDHNNDLRIAFKDSLGFAVPTQSIFYDPWGLSMKGMQITRNPLNFNKYQFLNRETQFETGYIDLLHRQFDPQTGRFTSQDPVIEGQEHLSLYQYGWNNPVLKPDPNGDCPKCGDFLNGVGNGFVGAFKAIGNAIAHPINTYNNAAQSSTAAFKADPVGFVVDNAISSSPVNSVREGYEFGKALAAGNSFGAGEMAGGKIAEVAIAAATEGAGRAVGAIGKGAGAEAVSLETRASEIHGTVSKATQSRTTIAVADAVNAEGKSVRIVGSSETKLRPAQRSMLNSNEVAASGPGHAEVTVLNHASKNGMTVGNIAASRPICPSCATSIQSAGATAKSVLKVVKDQ